MVQAIPDYGENIGVRRQAQFGTGNCLRPFWDRVREVYRDNAFVGNAKRR
jgi:hypothetical protein